jgi:hypothetical protein
VPHIRTCTPVDPNLVLEIQREFSDNAPIGWKVGLRAAQLIGGTLEARQESRRKINELYKLRNMLEGDGFEPSVPGAKEPVSGGKVTYG